MKKGLVVLTLSLVFVLIVFGSRLYANPQSAPHDQHGGGHASAPAGAPLMGKIVETMNGGGYTYILLQAGAKQIWVAVREMKVTVGENIALMPGIVMEGFTSKSINRTFDTIIFSDGPLGQNGQSGIAHGGAVHGGAVHGGAHKGAGQEKTTAGSQGAVPPAHDKIAIGKSNEENGYSVMELYEKRKELNKKNVVLRGQVVKVSAQIMGKNWLHIQDGTGYAQNGTNDIVVTTQDTASVGDVVSVKGILFSDKDFGSGYRYDAIIEQAHVTK